MVLAPLCIIEGMNKNITQLESDLSQFIGTTQYHRVSLNLVLTDGVHFLAEKAGAFWLVDVVRSVLPNMGKQDFLSIKLNKRENSSAIVTITDGNETELYKQEIEYTDFPLDEIQLFAQKSWRDWVLMLTSEY